MIRIRRIYSSVRAVDRAQIAQVQEIFRANFAGEKAYPEKIPDMLDHPFRYGFRAVLLVSLGPLSRVTGFVLVLHFPEINAAYLDFIAVRRDTRSGGIGGALYEAVREYLRGQGARGMYLEVLPDAPALVKDPARLEENRRRLRFYERYGVRPIADTAYETPVDESPAPHLLFDGLGRREPLRRAECRAAIRLILKRKYSHLVGPRYTEYVVASVKDDPVHIRPPRYVRREPHAEVAPYPGLEKAMAMVVTDAQRIHHVRERGYVERPARVDALRGALEPTGLFNEVPLRRHGEAALLAVHDGDFVRYLKAVCEKLSPTRPVYPYVFPIRRPERRPKDLALRAGYYCIDTFTPLDRNAYHAARSSVDVALTAAAEVLAGRPVAYAVCRPPGHHAQRRCFGGFCYFNNAAIAADRLAREGAVALLDIDFHHGNGAQDIFWQRADVFTQSIHGHPNYAYPYFSGFVDEVGEGPGKNFNQNYPLPEDAREPEYLAAFDKALARIRRFAPTHLVVALGFDTMKGDPTGSFNLGPRTLGRLGHDLAALRLPMLVVQEGGYTLGNLRRGSAAFFRGVARALSEEFVANT